MPCDSVIIFAGPTGGHLFPAMAFAESLRHQCGEKLFLKLVTGDRARLFMGKEESRVFDHVEYWRDFPMPRKIDFKGICSVWFFGIALIKSFIMLLGKRPDRVAGFGSFIAFPGILAAWVLGIKSIIHEQNYIPGKSTMFSARFASKTAISFSESRSFFTRSVEVTGYPLRRHFLSASQAGYRRQDRFCLLVLGGSQGARQINDRIMDIWNSMEDEEKSQYAVIHITGEEDFCRMKEAYQSVKVDCEVLDFTHRIDELFQKADLVIARAGAGTLFELAALGKPAIIIPYRHAFAHQKKNAEKFAEKNAIIMCDEEPLRSDRILNLVRDLKKNPERMNNLSGCIRQFHCRDAAERLTRMTVEF